MDALVICVLMSRNLSDEKKSPGISKVSSYLNLFFVMRQLLCLGTALKYIFIYEILSIQVDATFLFIDSLFRPPPPLPLACRLAKAIANLQCFSLAVDPSFRHFHLEASKEVELIHRLEFIRRKLPTKNSSGSGIPAD